MIAHDCRTSGITIAKDRSRSPSIAEKCFHIIAEKCFHIITDDRPIAEKCFHIIADDRPFAEKCFRWQYFQRSDDRER